MDTDRILENLKINKDSSFCVRKDIDLLKECSYEEHIFYIERLSSFYKQMSDWKSFPMLSILKMISYKKLEDFEARELIESRLESEV
jgi:hypothetical protein